MIRSPARPRLVLALLLALLSGCATLSNAPPPCPQGAHTRPDCPPPGAVEDPFVSELVEQRRWRSPHEIEVDPIEIGKDATILWKSARTRLLGPSPEGALDSLAAKLWMIEHAEHTVDAVYYIFTQDLIGQALLGALCDAVRRGVDVRLMVDAVGSFGLANTGLRSLQDCAREAGFMRTADGRVTVHRARVRVGIFNALTGFGNFNRRSHDKLLIVDGAFPDKAMVMTGGRNVSLDYYGITPSGEPDPDTYLDTEILLRPGVASVPGEPTVGDMSEIYFTLLLHFPRNREIFAVDTPETRATYREYRDRAAASLARLKSLPLLARHIDAMPRFMATGWHDSLVLLAHEFGNLTDARDLNDPLASLEGNPNSITYLLRESEGAPRRRLRLVSPYLFAARYHDAEGNLVQDEAAQVREWLEANPELEYEFIVNSVLTSDNIGAQSVIDMDLAPRLLLDPERGEAWRAIGWRDETRVELLGAAEWRALVEHPRLRIYQTGRLDDARLGGDRHYGKLHAKFLVEKDVGFVGTSNFDYRSRLFNNEMGFFVEGAGQVAEMNAAFDYLREHSYRWGSPEWLEMRQRLMRGGGFKGWLTRRQRAIYGFLKATGLKWYF